ncbi:hypothetical protein Tco_0601424 [Tanacetum coccineum]
MEKLKNRRFVKKDGGYGVDVKHNPIVDKVHLEKMFEVDEVIEGVKDELFSSLDASHHNRKCIASLTDAPHLEYSALEVDDPCEEDTIPEVNQ